MTSDKTQMKLRI